MKTSVIRWPVRVGPTPETIKAFEQMAQWMANRLTVGVVRYDPPRHERRYLSRLEREVKAYKRTGNIEHLINAANYCVLEYMRPEHTSPHHNNEAVSVTRGRPGHE